MKNYLFLRRWDGTQIAFVTFGTEARLYFNLGDAAVDTTEKAIEATDRVKYIGGATASALALDMVSRGRCIACAWRQ